MSVWNMVDKAYLELINACGHNGSAEKEVMNNLHVYPIWWVIYWEGFIKASIEVFQVQQFVRKHRMSTVFLKKYWSYLQMMKSHLMERSQQRRSIELLKHLEPKITSITSTSCFQMMKNVCALMLSLLGWQPRFMLNAKSQKFWRPGRKEIWPGLRGLIGEAPWRVISQLFRWVF